MSDFDTDRRAFIAAAVAVAAGSAAPALARAAAPEPAREWFLVVDPQGGSRAVSAGSLDEVRDLVGRLPPGARCYPLD